MSEPVLEGQQRGRSVRSAWLGKMDEGDDEMVDPRQQFGKKGESLAVEYLKKHGYRIIARNYRTGMGEIDIIARDKGILVFVEVKARRSFRFGNPKAAVTPRKQRSISMVALSYLKATKQESARARFDVVAVNSENDTACIEIVKNAFDLAYQ